MEPNPILRKLGYSNQDRLLIIHTDDIGMCHASNQAYKNLLAFGSISSGAAMVPCSWFPNIAEYCLQNTNADMGVHLTLTSEWENYRWSPLSTRSVETGLLDPEGYFYRTSEEAQLHVTPEAAQTELQQQVQTAFSAGIEVTHLDTHMNTIAHPKFVATYIQLAIHNKLPLLFFRKDEIGYQQLGLDPDTSLIASRMVKILEDQGMPLLDHGAGMNLVHPENRIDQIKKTLSEIPPGITHFIIHPSVDTPEIREITPDWQCRVADYQAFMDERIFSYIKELGLQVIGYKVLKDLLPA